MPDIRGRMSIEVVLGVVAIVALSAGSIVIAVRREAWRAQVIEDELRWRSVAETLAASLTSRLGRMPWERRSHARPPPDKGQTFHVEEGTVRGVDFVFILADVAEPETGRPIAGLTRAYVRMSEGRSRRCAAMEFSHRRPTAHAPATVDLERLSMVEPDVTRAAGRAAVDAMLSADREAREAGLPLASIITREARRIADAPTPPSVHQVVRTLLGVDPTARVAAEKAAQEALRVARRALDNGGREGRFAEARRLYELAIGAASACPEPLDRQTHWARALNGLALSCMGLAEALPATGPGLKARVPLVELALAKLKEAAVARTDPTFLARVHLSGARAQILLSPDAEGRRMAFERLDGLARAVGAAYPLGVDRPIEGVVPRNSLLAYQKICLADGTYAVSRLPPYGIFAVRHGQRGSRAILVTSPMLTGSRWPPTPDKDLVTQSEDGLKVAFRLREGEGGSATERVFTMDCDGTNLRDVSESDPKDTGSGWRPAWFAAWRKAPGSLPFGHQQVTVEDLLARPPPKGADTVGYEIDETERAKATTGLTRPGPDRERDDR